MTHDILMYTLSCGLWYSSVYYQWISWDTNNHNIHRDSDLHLCHWILDISKSHHSNGYMYGWLDLGTSTILSTYVKFLSDLCILNCSHLNFRIVHHNYVHAVVDCGDPPTIPNGSPGTPTSTAFGGTVSYTCNDRSRMLGSATVSCEASGSWSTRPTCSGLWNII